MYKDRETVRGTPSNLYDIVMYVYQTSLWFYKMGQFDNDTANISNGQTIKVCTTYTSSQH